MNENNTYNAIACQKSIGLTAPLNIIGIEQFQPNISKADPASGSKTKIKIMTTSALKNASLSILISTLLFRLIGIKVVQEQKHYNNADLDCPEISRIEARQDRCWEHPPRD
jgi:hypothetical protein